MRRGLARRCHLHCCGPGAEAVAGWTGTIDPGDAPVILAGLAGALRPTHRVGTAHVITEVRPENGKAIIPSWPDRHTNEPPRGGVGAAVVTSVATLVHEPAFKAALAARTGADLVDLESAAFASAAASRGWRWGIVRGVSDAADSDLPADVGTWIDAAGRLRWTALLAALRRRPALAGPLRRLGRDAREAMKAVAEQIWIELD